MGKMMYIASGLFGKPVRTILTGCCLVISFLMFGLLQPVYQLFDQGAIYTGDNRLVVSNKYSFTGVVPERYIPQIAGLAGVRNVAHQTYFGGTFRDPKYTFTRWAVPADTYLDIYRELQLDPAAKQAFAQQRTAVIVGRETADLLTLKVGDRIPIVPDVWPNKDGATWEFELVGIYDSSEANVDTTRMFVNYEFFDEYRAFGNGYVSNILVELDGSVDIGVIASKIDNMFDSGNWATKSATELSHLLSYAQQFGNVALIVSGILGAVFFTILLLTANTQAQSFRERTCEIGVLKSLGFTSRSVFSMLLLEAMLLTVTCAVVGMLLAFLLLSGVAQSLPGGLSSSLQVSSQSVAAALFIAVVVGFLVGLPSAVRAGRLDIVEALRY